MLAALILAAAISQGVPAHDWHLLTQSYGGTVSLISNLTEAECDKARDHLLWDRYPRDKNGRLVGGSVFSADNDVKSAICFK